MSIRSQIAADYGNEIKLDWEKELRTAYIQRDWNKIKALLEKIEKFFFSE